jgi:hypothetical protein
LVGDTEVLTMRSASALRFSKGCSSLNLDRMLSLVTDRRFVVCVVFLCERCRGCGRLDGVSL